MPYRKPDQYYIDLYDRVTIDEMKIREKKEAEELAEVADSDTERKWEVSMSHSMSFDSFRNYGVMRCRGRRDFVQAMATADERMDRLIEKTRIPKGIACKTCQMPMNVCNHFFDRGEAPILFVFECPNHHIPKRVIYPDGREYFFPKRKCKKCGFEIEEISKKLKTKIVTRCSCAMCGESWAEELELAPKEERELPVTEEERKKYCVSFGGKKTHMEELGSFFEVIADVGKEVAVKDEMETSGANKIIKLTIPELESLLVEASMKSGFVKFQLDKPEMKQYVRVPFSVQDPKRGEDESSKALARMLKRTLFPSNWRVVGNLSYRLGYLTGAVKAFERDEDLVKLAKEMGKRGKP